MAKNMVCLFGVFCSGLFLSLYLASCKFNYYFNNIEGKITEC